ncbi:MAG: DMT family transporter [Bacteroidetes bacterium]|nr:DMT family transporter [Bacteroidota bacterium]
MKLRNLALMAASGASIIYGANHTIAKELMPEVIRPHAFILLRVVGAAILFWLIAQFFPKERVDKKDRMLFFWCALFGMSINMTSFFKGLELSTPINSSVVITLVPVILLVLGRIFLKESISALKATGIFIGLAGALGLVLLDVPTQANAPNIPLGNLYFMLNAFSYSIYLILVKPLTHKYHAITLMKYFFLIAIPLNIPLGYQEFSQVAWTSLSFDSIWRLCFVVVATTVLTYLFNIFALKQLSPSTIGAFIYLQPIIATIVALASGVDHLNAIRIFAALFIFAGVYLSSRQRLGS